MASLSKQGQRGLEGPTGPAGPQGTQGPVGPEGPQGPDGEGTVGAEGPQGSPGPQGAVGPAGPQGAVGPEGADGDEGPQGAVGPTGPKGADGDEGPQGAVGPTGPKGADGELPEVENWHVVGEVGQPEFGAGWSNFSEPGFAPVPLRFRKDELGDVVIEGFVAGVGAGRNVFVLPVGYRPKGGLLCFPQTGSSQAFRLDILEDGTVVSSSATVIFMTLTARFRAE